MPAASCKAVANVEVNLCPFFNSRFLCSLKVKWWLQVYSMSWNDSAVTIDSWYCTNCTALAAPLSIYSLTATLKYGKRKVLLFYWNWNLLLTNALCSQNSAAYKDRAAPKKMQVCRPLNQQWQVWIALSKTPVAMSALPQGSNSWQIDIRVKHASGTTNIPQYHILCHIAILLQAQTTYNVLDTQYIHKHWTLNIIQ